jgi:hypothetical protein
LEPTGDLPKVLQELVDNPFAIGNPSIGDLYNLLPWSFLADYFSSLGDYVEHQSNLMPYKVTSLCLMCTAEVRFHVTVGTSPSNRITDTAKVNGEYTMEEKYRWVYYNPMAAPAFSPLLTGNQVANIAALAIAFSTGGRSTRTL